MEPNQQQPMGQPQMQQPIQPERKSSSMGIVIGIILIVVIALVAWVAYDKGFFSGQQEEPQNGIEIDIGAGE